MTTATDASVDVDLEALLDDGDRECAVGRTSVVVFGFQLFKRGACQRPAHALVRVVCTAGHSARVPVCRQHLDAMRRHPRTEVGCFTCDADASWSGGDAGDRF
ncbi:hypothetical protein GCM10027456_24840 [Kineosporia babensis]